MFFIASKLFWSLLQPSSLLVLGLLMGVWLVSRGQICLGLRWLVGSIAGIVIIGLSAVADLLAVPLENRFSRAVSLVEIGAQSISGIIVLGGAEDLIAVGRELLPMNDAAERLTEAVALSRRHASVKLVVSGSPLTKPFFYALGVAPDRLIFEEESRTTYENAIRTRDVVMPKSGERWLLVTSAWHMPRAVGCFRTAGFDVIAWPVDHRTRGYISPVHLFGSLPEGLRRFDLMSKELVGLLAYRLTGRTDALFPGPRKVQREPALRTPL